MVLNASVKNHAGDKATDQPTRSNLARFQTDAEETRAAVSPTGIEFLRLRHERSTTLPAPNGQEALAALEKAILSIHVEVDSYMPFTQVPASCSRERQADDAIRRHDTGIPEVLLPVSMRMRHGCKSLRQRIVCCALWWGFINGMEVSPGFWRHGGRRAFV
ncbi:hypothetical protein CC80DRAFT_510348 [Byssothecium circinans]|uniref:Uncharacterized protein n=1 Tax=Byssothecium circinans TaxID=147558 RepID=A0A6A5T9U5_9PLEO|nr:hypothetical protein CC80DRAFT_510348 [Byssothecium circinans]